MNLLVNSLSHIVMKCSFLWVSSGTTCEDKDASDSLVVSGEPTVGPPVHLTPTTYLFRTADLKETSHSSPINAKTSTSRVTLATPAGYTSSVYPHSSTMTCQDKDASDSLTVNEQPTVVPPVHSTPITAADVMDKSGSSVTYAKTASSRVTLETPARVEKENTSSIYPHRSMAGKPPHLKVYFTKYSFLCYYFRTDTMQLGTVLIYLSFQSGRSRTFCRLCSRHYVCILGNRESQ